MKTKINTKTPVHPRFSLFEGHLCFAVKPFGMVIRERFAYHHKQIDTVAKLKSTLRAGDTAWPGGYPLFFVTSDGAALSFESVLENFRAVVDSIKHNCADGWQVIGCEVNWEQGDLTCEHSGKSIQSAYGESVQESFENELKKEIGE